MLVANNKRADYYQKRNHIKLAKNQVTKRWINWLGTPDDGLITFGLIYDSNDAPVYDSNDAPIYESSV